MHGDDDGVVTFDQIADELQTLRTAAGLPSYADIVVRIAQERSALSVPGVAARPARTTVYDAFRPGRRRLDPVLVGEIVRALGVDEIESRTWETRVRNARAAAPAGQVTAPPPAEPTAMAAPTPESTPVRRTRPTPRFIVAVVLGSLLLNLLGRTLVNGLDLSIYLDMVGTAVTAVVLGPWWGVLVGVSTNVGAVTLDGLISIPFALVNATGALVWGYGVHRFGWGRTLGRYFTLNIIAAVACSLVAVPIIVALGGETHHRSDYLVDRLHAVGELVVAWTFLINILLSMLDKTLSGFAALVVAEIVGRPVDRLPAATRTGRDHA